MATCTNGRTSTMLDNATPAAMDRVSDDDAALIAHFYLAVDQAQRAVDGAECELAKANYALQVLGGRLAPKYGLGDADKIARDGTIIRAASLIAETDAPEPREP